MHERNRRMNKTGKSALNIFAPTLPPEAPDPPNPVQRSIEAKQAVQEQDRSKVTVVLLNRQIVYLDRLTASIRECTGSSVKRAEVIRALIDTLIDSGWDRELTQARSENELRNLLASRLAS